MMRVEFWGGVYGWVIIDTDKVPSNENYHGLCACGFESEQDALEYGIGRWRPRARLLRFGRSAPCTAPHCVRARSPSTNVTSSISRLRRP
jgi:hypothetical protein